jgi:reactive intermediate/imine deaminase
MNKNILLISSILILFAALNTVYAKSSTMGADSAFRQEGNLIFISGQGAGSVKTNKNSRAQIEDAFKKLQATANAAGGELNDVIKVTVYLTDLSADYSALNDVTREYFKKPFPARSTVGVASLPKDHRIEVDAVMVVKSQH